MEMTRDELEELERFKAEEAAAAGAPQRDLARFKGHEGRGNISDAISREMSFGLNDEFASH